MAFCIVCQILCGVAGISICATPSGFSASTTALIVAGSAPVGPDSPPPVAPIRLDAVIVGADRITRNGDVANKIGTYSLAVLARFHEIPMYVAAPWTTVDLELLTGADVEVEERSADEVRLHGGARLSPVGVQVHNPAFDVTPAALISAIVTETGVFEPGQLAAAAPGGARV